MKRKTNYFLIGAFVLAGTVLTVVGVVLLGAGAFANRGLIVETYFTESVQGLEQGAVVRFRGVRIGTVSEIALASQLYETGAPYPAVRCEIALTEGAPTPEAAREQLARRIASGFRMRLATQGITGALYVEMDKVSGSPPPPLEIDWEPRYFHVPSSPSRIEQLGSAVERLLENLSAADVAGIVEDARATLRRIDEAMSAADFASFGRAVNDVASEARGLLAELRESVSDVADRLERTADSADRVIAAIPPEDLARTTQALAEFAEGLPATRARFDATLAEADRVLDRVRTEIAAGSRDFGAILADLGRAARHLANLAETAELYPSLLLRGGAPLPTEMEK